MAEDKGRTESGKDTRSAAEDASRSARGGAKQAADKVSEAAGMAANGAEEFTAHASNNVAAIMECGPILADGFQSIWREWITCNRNVLSQNVEGLNKIMRSRTINDLLAAQSDLLKSDFQTLIDRSEERRVGKECVSTCRSRWSPSH